MASGKTGSALGLKVRRARPAAGGSGSSLAAAVRLYFDLKYGVQVRALDGEAVPRGELSDLAERFGATGVYLALGQNGHGFVHLDDALVATLIELCTTGQVGMRPVTPRAGTAIDAIIAAGFVRALFEAAASLAEDTGAAVPDLARQSVAEEHEDPRSLGVDIGTRRMDCVELVIEAGSAREGRIRFATAATATPARRSQGGAGEGEAVRDAAVAELEAVLCRIRLPISRIRQLAEGQVLAIPAEALAQISVEAGHRRYATARLGQVEDSRALKFTLSGPAAGQLEVSSGFSGAKMRGAADLPKPGGLPELPAIEGGALPDLPAVEGGALPDLPDLPDIGDLPDLPDLTDLPALDDTEPALS